MTSPLDVLKIRFQTQGELTHESNKIYKSVFHGGKVIIQNEGIKGLYKGLFKKKKKKLKIIEAN